MEHWEQQADDAMHELIQRGMLRTVYDPFTKELVLQLAENKIEFLDCSNGRLTINERVIDYVKQYGLGDEKLGQTWKELNDGDKPLTDAKELIQRLVPELSPSEVERRAIAT